MRKVIYLSLGAPHLEYPLVEAALRDEGVEARMVHLDAWETLDLHDVELVNLRMCRWYHKQQDFLQRVEALHERLQAAPGGPIALANPLPLVVDALDKGRYLRKLAEDGIELIPTRWIAAGTSLQVAQLMAETGWDDVVIKPTVSSGSWNTIRVSRQGRSTSDSHFVLTGDGFAQEAALAALVQTHDLCVQPFQPAVMAFGELSFVFLGGELSHVVRKTVDGRGGWWAHERLGGHNYRWQATAEERRWAEEVYAALERRYGRLWFGRVDGLHAEDGRLRLLECELAIPRLLLPEGQAFQRYARVIAAGLRQGARPASLASVP